MGEAIPKFIREDKILEHAVNESVPQEVRSKYNAEHVSLKMPTTEHPPVALTRETPATEEPPSPKKQYMRGTSNRGGR